MSEPMTDENAVEILEKLATWADELDVSAITVVLAKLAGHKGAMRPEVRKFAKAMEAVLEENDYNGGWEEETIDYLYEKLQEEIKEVYLEARKFDYFGGMPDEIKGDTADLCRELVDVANVCMMLRARLEETK